MNTKIYQGVELILDGLVPGWQEDPNFRDTPRRVTKMYEELFSTEAPVLTVFPETHNQMIILAHHKAYSLCPHHLLPIEMDISLAYIPKGFVLGISKLARMIHMKIGKPSMQETLTDELADILYDVADTGKNCLGSAVLIKAEHDCMKIRGVKSSGHIITSAVRGVFKDDPSAKEEFLSLVKP